MIPLKFAILPAILLISAAASHADIVVYEPFAGYVDGAELGGATNQTALGFGLSGLWNGSGYFKSQDAGLTMTGVTTSGGSASLLISPGDSLQQVDVGIDVSLSSGTFYGSYLFTLTHDGSQGRTVGAIGIGDNNMDDNTAAFVWAGDAYNTNTIEGPGIRAQGSSGPASALSLTSGETYIYLFEFNASTGTTSGWVLSQAQLTNFYGTLDAATLDAATTDTTDSTGIFWRGTVTNPITAGTGSFALMGLDSTDSTFNFEYDEIRISDTSLSESITAVPEPSTVALFAIASGFGIWSVRRRRRIS